MTFRGSRMHVLDWVDGAGGSFHASLNALLDGTHFRVAEGCRILPVSTSSPQEARLGKNCGGLLTSDQNRMLRDWWLVRQRGANVPNWDLACHASFTDRQTADQSGLVLIEAKANVPEFTEGEGGKLAGNAENDAQIARAITEAQDAFRSDGWDIKISRDRWYQLSNRIAFAWKLASMGVPTVLIYLGFTRDEGIRDVGEPIRDEEHWRGLVMSVQNVVPPNMWGTEIRVAGTPLHLLIRTLPCVRQSPSRIVGRNGVSSPSVG
jgi:hypothetical protein